MAIPQIESTDIPESMRTRASAYNFDPGQLGTPNGYGKVTRTGPQSLIWSFAHMTTVEMDWWLAFLSGSPSVTLTQMRVWDKYKTMREFTSGELYEPLLRGRYRGGRFWDVQIEIQHILPYYTLATEVP